jgi:hypothetical protein
MKPRSAHRTAQPSITAYIIISVAGFLVSGACVYYYVHNVLGNVSEAASQRIFYIILVVFGISSSAMVFGAMNSYGVLKGEQRSTKFRLTGPVVGVVLVVLGGFYLPKGAMVRQPLSVRLVNQALSPIAGGRIILYFPNYTRESVVDDKGLALFSDISEDEITSRVKFDIVCDGYMRRTFDTLLKTFSPIQVMLAEAGIIHISGKVVTAAEIPIPDVVVMLDGTKFFGKTVTDGTYSFDITGYKVGDELSLVSSNKDYADKTKTVKIDRQELSRVDFVLQPLSPVHR